jgi:hypothetical protein
MNMGEGALTYRKTGNKPIFEGQKPNWEAKVTNVTL